MPTTLKNLRIRRVALVDKGANQEAFITLYKRDDAQEVQPMAETTETTQPVETVTKAEHEVAVAKIAELEALAKAAQERAETAEAELAKQAEAAEQAEFATRAAAIPFLGETGGETLRQIHKALGEAYQAFEDTLLGVAKQLEASGLLTEQGTAGTEGGTDFASRSEALAKRFQQEDPSLTFQQAYVKALEDPELKALYAQERGGK